MFIIIYLHLKKTSKPNFIFLIPTDRNEIIDIIKTLRHQNSSGHDHLGTNFLKFISLCIANLISKLMNKSLETGIFPDALKIAKLIPIHQTKAKTNFSNYRPIPLFPTLSKKVKKIMHKHTSFYLETYEILYKKTIWI